jgi:hypothetical protein
MDPSIKRPSGPHKSSPEGIAIGVPATEQEDGLTQRRARVSAYFDALFDRQAKNDCGQTDIMTIKLSDLFQRKYSKYTKSLLSEGVLTEETHLARITMRDATRYTLSFGPMTDEPAPGYVVTCSGDEVCVARGLVFQAEDGTVAAAPSPDKKVVESYELAVVSEFLKDLDGVQRLGTLVVGASSSQQ